MQTKALIATLTSLLILPLAATNPPPGGSCYVLYLLYLRRQPIHSQRGFNPLFPALRSSPTAVSGLPPKANS